MRVETLGDGPAELAVIGGIHGDEPCGVRAVERFLSERPPLERPVKFVVANEAAIAQDRRYLDEDLNRAFPGDPDGDTHESRLASRLAREIESLDVLALHSTQSYGGKFALVDVVEEYERSVCTRLSVDTVVETCEFTEGRIFAVAPRTVEVECGYQGSDAAAENAAQLTREFLAATGALADEEPAPGRELPVYRLTEPLPKAAAEVYEVFTSNFRRVNAGEVFATADEEEYVANDSFYPVLMSPYGYEDVFGYAARKIGTVSPAD